MIVTIDGPAGAGKSTVARALAQRLGFAFLDTGALYRCVALAALRAGVPPEDERLLGELLSRLAVQFEDGRVTLNGEDVSQAIRTPEVTALARAVADRPVVRQHLSRWQRQFAQGRDIVTEGRDQGTVVFPEAQCKFFLTADPRERARRRCQELAQRGLTADLDRILQEQQERDARDAARDIAPMVPAPDAIVLDTTFLSVEEVVARIEEEVRRKMPARDR
jgi:cytidylate kinase